MLDTVLYDFVDDEKSLVLIPGPSGHCQPSPSMNPRQPDRCRTQRPGTHERPQYRRANRRGCICLLSYASAVRLGSELGDFSCARLSQREGESGTHHLRHTGTPWLGVGPGVVCTAAPAQSHSFQPADISVLGGIAGATTVPSRAVNVTGARDQLLWTRSSSCTSGNPFLWTASWTVHPCSSRSRSPKRATTQLPWGHDTYREHAHERPLKVWFQGRPGRPPSGHDHRRMLARGHRHRDAHTLSHAPEGSLAARPRLDSSRGSRPNYPGKYQRPQRVCRG